jgi:hypothetical protein
MKKLLAFMCYALAVPMFIMGFFWWCLVATEYDVTTKLFNMSPTLGVMFYFLFIPLSIFIFKEGCNFQKK